MDKNSKKERPLSVFFISPEVLLSYEDLTCLPYLYDETVVDCVEARYKEDRIYTWAGPILIGVNPLKNINHLYSEDQILKVHNILKVGHDHKDPHVFTVAGLAHRRLIAEIGLINQTVLVSGESGAGKTESAKFILTYLTHVESEKVLTPETLIMNCQEAQDIQKKILASNPIMEAFGNALTLRNHNSSRFGKLIRMQYHGQYLRGATMDTYLLERTRVTSQPPKECNFHIFYQLLFGLQKSRLFNFEVERDVTFCITPGTYARDSSKDLENLQETVEALQEIGFSEYEQKEIFQVVLAIMYLGNISFDPCDDKESWTLCCDKGSKEAANKASQYLGLPIEILKETFTVKKIAVTSRNKTTVFNKACEREDQCRARRDSLMQLLYTYVFSYLVSSINEKTKTENSPLTSYLGVLDIYGFEAFEDNSLEQLCINYTNERLQQEFTRRYIASEHKMLVEEGFLEFPFIYSDNIRCVNALDSSVSVFAILNEECQLRRALNEEGACERVCNALQGTGVVSQFSSRKKAGFLIKHYAGNVNYSASGLLQKNRDEVPQDVFDLLSVSTNQFILNFLLTKKEEDWNSNVNKGRKSVKKITTLSKFKGSLDTLLKILANCDLHYMRCLKPNSSGVAGNHDKSFLLDQLRTNGILETVKISRAGYPVRLFYDDFVKRYDFHHSYVGYEDKEITFIILIEVLGQDPSGSPPEDKCRFGKNRIFLSENCLHQLEERRRCAKDNAATCIQKNFRKYIEEKRYRTTLGAISTLQRKVLCWLQRKRFQKMKESTVLIQKTFRGFYQRKNYQKNLMAIKVIQKHWKGWFCRRKYLLLQKTNLLLEDSRSQSRISYSSVGYGSLAPSSLTDYSASEAETATIEESGRVERRLFETEESGIETDTESLSGEWHKSGRACRLKSRHNLAQFRPVRRGSDDESFDVVPATNFCRSEASKLRAQVPRVQTAMRKSGAIKHSENREAFQNSIMKLEKKIPYIGLISKTDFIAFKNLLKMDYSKREFSLSLSTSFNVSLFYKDGVLSYRHYPKGKIKFHTRSTCIPYSTRPPIYDKPRGLVDALR